MNATIKANAAMTAINALVLASISYDAALDTVRAECEAGRLTRPDARIALTLAYAHHKASYKAQVVVEKGVPVRNSALERKVNSDLSAIFNAEKNSAKDTAESIEVPEDIAKVAAKLWAMCSEYEGAGKLAALALAQARAAK